MLCLIKEISKSMRKFHASKSVQLFNIRCM
jgi:hypothetical protein